MNFTQRSKNFSGFTLIEVIVSIAILSITFVLIMQLFAKGLQSARLSCDYTRAIVLAKDKMEEMVGSPLSASGEYDDGYRWETDVQPYNELEGDGANLVKIKVKVMWTYILNREKSIELVSLKAMDDEESM